MSQGPSNLISFFVAPSFLVSAVVAFFNVARQQITTNEQQKEENENKIQERKKKKPTNTTNELLGLMSEAPPSKKIFREELPKQISEQISDGKTPLDRDIAFVLGETNMPLNVYQSPLVVAYRQFQEMKKDDTSDSYYKTTLEKDLTSSLDKTIEQLFEDDNNDEERDILLLYGRGPIFKMQNDYSDRFLGFDD
ncbi:hypothetical protein ABK040_016199 [Willaertia magna]